MLLTLLIASFTDIKKKEIPIFLFPSLFILNIILNFNNIYLPFSLIGLIIGALSFTIMALYFSGGGGDIIMMAVLGFILGPKILMHIIIVSSLLCIIYYLIKKEQKIAYAPFVTVSYILCYLGGELIGINDYGNLGFHYFLL